MKLNHNEDSVFETTDFTENLPLYADDRDRKDDVERDDDEEIDAEEEIDERQDWGDVDPAGGPAPSAPGSAV